MALRDHIRAGVRYESAQAEGRPFLRDSARRTLESGQGYCGEASRAFVCLAEQLDIRAQRVNLHGAVQHVVVEVEIRPGEWILVDPQDSAVTNPLFDAADVTLDQMVGSHPYRAVFQDYSNINLRRVPLLGSLVQRIKLHHSWATWTLENPALTRSYGYLALALLMIALAVLDMLLRHFYAFRLGLHRAARGNNEPFLQPVGVRAVAPAALQQR